MGKKKKIRVVPSAGEMIENHAELNFVSLSELLRGEILTFLVTCSCRRTPFLDRLVVSRQVSLSERVKRLT